jgi:hypothetical protein
VERAWQVGSVQALEEFAPAIATGGSKPSEQLPHFGIQ